MNVFIVYAHPSSESFTRRVLDSLMRGLYAAGHAVEVSDLYAMDFRSDMSPEEYEREGFANTDLPIPADVLAEQAKIENADCIVLLYPLWWSDCPAKLKGWFDRVYSVGYAYGYDEHGNRSRKMKTIRYGIAVTTAGHPNHYLEATGIAGSMRKIMLEDRLGLRFENKKMLILGGTLDIENVMQSHLEKAEALGRDIEGFFAV